MRMFSRFISMAFCAALSMFSFSVLAAPASIGWHSVRYAVADVGYQGDESCRHELTLTQWRTSAGDTSESVSAYMRASSHGFVFNGIQGQHAVSENTLS